MAMKIMEVVTRRKLVKVEWKGWTAKRKKRKIS